MCWRCAHAWRQSTRRGQSTSRPLFRFALQTTTGCQRKWLVEFFHSQREGIFKSGITLRVCEHLWKRASSLCACVHDLESFRSSAIFERSKSATASSWSWPKGLARDVFVRLTNPYSSYPGTPKECKSSSAESRRTSRPAGRSFPCCYNYPPSRAPSADVKVHEEQLTIRKSRTRTAADRAGLFLSA